MNQRDLELLSSYLDGQLSPSDVSRLEGRLKIDPQLISVLNDLRATRSLLRKLPKRRAPRNFTLTRKMVGLNPPMPKVYPIFRFASAIATLLLVFSFGLNSFARYSAAPLGIGGGMGGGGGADESYAAAPMEAPVAAAEESAAAEAPAEPFTNLAPMPTQMPPAEDTTRVMETPSSKAGDEASSGLANQTSVEIEAQRPASSLFSSAWQIGLAVVAILSLLLMFALRQMAMSRWK